MKYLTSTEARRFAEAWLPAWTGNNPEHLASFYSEDAFYLDPAIPEGVKGKPALIGYFRKLLAYNPNWVWKQIEGIPLEHGFLNKWQAAIPVGSKIIEVAGVCLVQLDGTGKIRRNEVYFDRFLLLKEIERQRAAHPADAPD
ncbi:MAG: hypothetical protein C4519_10675 [Desulfobacteraceae bacterium]|nr:MAG: hypothetical protein C4519_10675 [Desulfobacteraceae bacterium]